MNNVEFFALEKEKGKIDPECLRLCEAINKFPGLFTTGSCCGHGKRSYNIYFKAMALESLPPLLYWLDNCHNSLTGWFCEVYTDCAMSPVSFAVKGPIGAYNEAEKIAQLMEGYLDEMQ